MLYHVSELTIWLLNLGFLLSIFTCVKDVQRIMLSAKRLVNGLDKMILFMKTYECIKIYIKKEERDKTSEKKREVRNSSDCVEAKI